MELNKACARKAPLLFIAALCCLPFTILSQTQKHWVLFTDKNNTPYSLTSPDRYLSDASIGRRLFYNIAVDATDLPVDPEYVEAVEGVADVKVLYASKWLNGVVVEVPQHAAASALAGISTMPFVKSTGRVNRYIIHDPAPDPLIDGAGRNSAASGPSFGGSGGQIRQLNLHCLHERGFRGQCMTIAVCDAGFSGVNTASVFDSLRTRGGIIGTYDFVDGDPDVYGGGSHGTSVLSCMAAISPGKAMGTAPLADYWLFRTEEGARETISEEYNWIRAAEFADSVGADIITTSLGYTTFDEPGQNHSYQTLNGRTAPMSIAATMAARKGMFVLNAAGNEGGNSWNYVSVPADADSICAVGAVDTSGNPAPFSSVGPTADGRTKPDLAATGWGTWICDSGDLCYPGSGTSFATPVLAGAVACYWQANRSRNNIAVLNDLRNAGTKASAPDNKVGWGIPKIPCPGGLYSAAACAKLIQDLPFDFRANISFQTSRLTVFLSTGNHKNIRIEIFDLLGKRIYSGDGGSGVMTVFLNAETLSDHLYIVKVSSSLGSGVKKVLRF